MLNRTRTCALLMAIMLCTGCQNIGSNSSYLLKYKKDLRKSYEDNIEKAAKDSTKRNMANEAEIYLPRSIALTFRTLFPITTTRGTQNIPKTIRLLIKEIRSTSLLIRFIWQTMRNGYVGQKCVWIPRRLLSLLRLTMAGRRNLRTY